MKLLIIDGNNLAHRAHHTRENLTSRGRPTSVLAGVLSMLGTIARRMPETPILWVWDGGGRTWRHTLLDKRQKRIPTLKASYKEGRPDHQIVDDQIRVLAKFLGIQMGFQSLRIRGVEADDVIGIMATALKTSYEEVIIYSGDRDFFQMIYGNVRVWRPVAGEKKPSFVGYGEVKKQFGIHLQDWLKYRALTGDETDRIPNACRGLGPKTAAKFVSMGVDASLLKYEFLPKEVREDKKVKSMLEDCWKDVNDNYFLCKIIREHNSGLLPLGAPEKLELAINRCRDEGVCRTGGSYNEMLKFMADYQLNEAYDKRSELWSIP